MTDIVKSVIEVHKHMRKRKSEKWLKRLSQIRYPAVKMTSFEPPKGHENVTQWGGRFNQNERRK